MKIKASKCQLTELTVEDYDLFHKLYVNPDVRKFLGGLIAPEDIEDKFRKTLLADAESLFWVVSTIDQIQIGLVSLTAHHDAIDREVSYQFLPEYWGKGYAFDAVAAVLSYAKHTLKLDRVVAETQAANLASRNLLERLGMHHQQTLLRFGAEQVIYTT